MTFLPSNTIDLGAAVRQHQQIILHQARSYPLSVLLQVVAELLPLLEAFFLVHTPAAAEEADPALRKLCETHSTALNAAVRPPAVHRWESRKRCACDLPPVLVSDH